MSNENLTTARVVKNDEFYTKLEDIEKELQYYKDQLKDKTVLCNCDDKWSNFYKYFHLCFNSLGLKKLICTHYEKNKASYAYVYGGENDDDIDVCTTIQLEGNGDFCNEECLEFLDEADVVITNPPFSLFREFIATLEEHQKKYLVIGNMNAATCKKIFPLFKNDKMRFGYTKPSGFITPERDLPEKTGIFTTWFTNLDVKKRNEKLTLKNKYSPEKYQHYDNYDAINVDKISDIPSDYDGVMGVPITYLDKHCPEQFEILGLACKKLKDENLVNQTKIYINAKQHDKNGNVSCGNKINDGSAIIYDDVPDKYPYYTSETVPGKYIVATYTRVLIKRK